MRSHDKHERPQTETPASSVGLKSARQEIPSSKMRPKASGANSPGSEPRATDDSNPICQLVKSSARPGNEAGQDAFGAGSKAKHASKAVRTSAQAVPEHKERVARRSKRWKTEAVLVGPKAAGLLGWDGFAASDPEVWLVPRYAEAGKSEIRTSRWAPATRTIGGYPIANDELVLAYLEESLKPQPRWVGDREPISVVDRIELAVEWLLRNNKSVGLATLRATKTEQTVKKILKARGLHEPPTESHAETRFIQQMRKFGITKVFRQVPLYRGDDVVNRIDIVIAFLGRPRPKRFTNRSGIPVEIDGKAFHIDTFEKDRKRGNEHSINQTRLLVITTHMIERNPKSIYFSICRIHALRAKASSHSEHDLPTEPW